MSNDLRIRKAIENWDAYVEQLATMPDKVLSEKLDIINMQAEIARERNITSSSELLEIWWRQVVEARTYKAENNIPDAPNEIELAIADIEVIVSRSEERKAAFDEINDTNKNSRSKTRMEIENDDQLSLF